ncbi:MAG: PPC domain-containing protein [Spirulinaceae cyanobacterium]
MMFKNTIIFALILSISSLMAGTVGAQSPEPSPSPTSEESPDAETPEESEAETPTEDEDTSDIPDEDSATEAEEATTPVPAEPIFVLEEEGSLSDGDMTLPEDDSLYDIYSFEGKRGNIVNITVESDDFDTYLVLIDDNQEIVDKNDDISQNNTNSALSEIVLPRDGLYRVVVNGYNKADRGNYRITIRVEN